MISQTICTSFKVELLTGTHDFTPGTGDTFKIALYSSSATLDATTTTYSTTNEITGTGYTAGGETLTAVAPTSSGTVAYVDFNDVSWAGATFTCRGALIYNSTNSDKAVCVMDFGSDKTVTAGTFTVQFPSPTSTTAIVRID